MKRVLKIKNRKTFKYFKLVDFVEACNSDFYIRWFTNNHIINPITKADLDKYIETNSIIKRHGYLHSQIYVLWTAMLKANRLECKELKFAFLDYINFDFLNAGVKSFFILSQAKSFNKKVENIRTQFSIPMPGFNKTGDFEQWFIKYGIEQKNFSINNTILIIKCHRINKKIDRFREEVAKFFADYNLSLESTIPIIYILFGFNNAGETNLAFYINRSTFGKNRLRLITPTRMIDYPDELNLSVASDWVPIRPKNQYLMEIYVADPLVNQKELTGLISDNFTLLKAEMAAFYKNHGRSITDLDNSVDRKFKEYLLEFLLRQEGYKPAKIEELVKTKYFLGISGGRQNHFRQRTIIQNIYRFKLLIKKLETSTN